MNFPDIDKSDSEDESSFNMVNPDLIDFNVVSNGVWNFISVSSVTVASLLLQPEQLCSLSSLNRMMLIKVCLVL